MSLELISYGRGWFVALVGAATVVWLALISEQVRHRALLGVYNKKYQFLKKLRNDNWPNLTDREPSKLAIFKRKKMLIRLERELPETLDNLADMVVAGLTLNQGIEQLASDSPESVAKIFRALKRGSSLGLSLEESLRRISKQIKLSSFTSVSDALRSSLTFGGDCIPILRNLSKVIRDEQKNVSEINALTSGGKTSGVVISMLIPAILLFFWLFNPEYLTLLFETSLGRIGFGISMTLEIVGYFWIKEIVRVL